MLRSKSVRFGAIRTLLFIGVFALGLTATAAKPARASTSGTWNNTGSMNVARIGQTSILLPNGQVLAAGGENNTKGYLSSAELYNSSTGRWTLTGSMSVPRFGHDAVLLQNGEVLVAGGTNPTQCCGAPPLTSAELYNPSNGTWTPTGSMTIGRESFIMALLPNGEVLAAGGDNGDGGFYSSAELYNPATGTWTATTSMTTTEFEDISIVLQNGEVFVSQNLNLYNSSTATWSVVTNAPSGRGQSPLVLLPNNNVFVGNGGTFGDDIVNIPANQWTNIPPAPCTSLHQSCEARGALLNTGNILLAGGITVVHALPYNLDETNGFSTLLNPATLTWTSTGNMKTSRVGYAINVLPNGQVLAAGGETFDKKTGALVPIANAELYTP